MIFALILGLLCSSLCLGLPLPVAAAPVGWFNPAIAQAVTPTPTQALERLFETDTVPANWFTPQFLQQIPIQQIRTLLTQLRQSMGPLRSIEPEANGYELTFSQGIVPAQIQLNAQGQIALLFFGPPEAPVILEEAVSAVQAFPGVASLLVLGGETVLADVRADTPLAVGSAFKLAVLAALQDEIAQGRLNWDDVVTLQPRWRSLPSGFLQDWPDGTALTLETLATLMIAVSDNTATDALIDVVGRETVEALTLRNQPLLTTREFFTLKNPANAERLTAFRNAPSAAEKRQLLETLATAPLPDASLFAGNPIALDVEWFLSTQELCGLMAQGQDLPLMGVNPGLAKPQAWQAIAFKGGAEPGVLSLVSGLEATNGERYCVAATWNDPTQPLDEVGLSRLYGGVVAGLVSNIDD